MDISSFSAIRNYASSRPATEPAAGSDNFGRKFDAVARDFTATLREAENTAIGAMSGTADTQSLVMALAQTELAVETAVTVRNKVVEAYQEILRMPV